MKNQIFTVVSSNISETTQKLAENGTNYWINMNFGGECCKNRTDEIEFSVYKGSYPNREDLVLTACHKLINVE